MRKEKLFNETIDKLVKAYFEGTLKHSTCEACAVTTIVGIGCKWNEYFATTYINLNLPTRGRSIGHLTQNIFPNTRPFPILPYSMQDLMDIEWAFETAPKEGDWEFNGLMAVVDVLERIHECDKETTTATKQRFVKVTP